MAGDIFTAPVPLRTAIAIGVTLRGGTIIELDGELAVHVRQLLLDIVELVLTIVCIGVFRLEGLTRFGFDGTDGV